MILTVKPSQLSGTVPIPGSKSHTIRGVVIASLAEGTSVLRSPLNSADAEAAVRVCRGLGAEIALTPQPPLPCGEAAAGEGENGNGDGAEWRITGVGGRVRVPDDVLDVGNSGTTLYVAAAAAALADGYSVFTGDEQIRRRPVEALLAALRDLGAEAFTTRGNGCAPFVIRGPLRGGKVAIKCPASQYLTALLLSVPLAEGDTEIEVLELTEHPYVEMTLHWLDRQGIKYERSGFDRFMIPGRQSYRAFDQVIPADWSSATFFLCAGAIGQSELRLTGLDLTDPQGDKAVVEMLRKMGAEIAEVDGAISVRGGKLHGAELDLNATPDALPALAVTACFAEGETRLVNVAQARLKETDRIAVMAKELRKMGAAVEEREDGLVIQGSPLHGTSVHGHGDHRVVMSLAVAGTFAEGTTVIDTAEAMAVTFPNFAGLMSSLGGNIELTQ
ncbi:MAG: 3-phosphoshikimate 1-carboxyvinyltransferase [Bacteroidota bacterium]